MSSDSMSSNGTHREFACNAQHKLAQHALYRDVAAVRAVEGNKLHCMRHGIEIEFRGAKGGESEPTHPDVEGNLVVEVVSTWVHICNVDLPTSILAVLLQCRDVCRLPRSRGPAYELHALSHRVALPCSMLGLDK